MITGAPRARPFFDFFVVCTFCTRKRYVRWLFMATTKTTDTTERRKGIIQSPTKHHRPRREEQHNNCKRRRKKKKTQEEGEGGRDQQQHDGTYNCETTPSSSYPRVAWIGFVSSLYHRGTRRIRMA